MINKIEEEIGVIAIYQHDRTTPLPWKIKWKSRYYTFRKVDLCHPVWEGKTLHHVFSVCDGNMYFRLDLNTRTQKWMLMETSDGLPN